MSTLSTFKRRVNYSYVLRKRTFNIIVGHIFLPSATHISHLTVTTETAWIVNTTISAINYNRNDATLQTTSVFYLLFFAVHEHDAWMNVFYIRSKRTHIWRVHLMPLQISVHDMRRNTWNWKLLKNSGFVNEFNILHFV